MGHPLIKNLWQGNLWETSQGVQRERISEQGERAYIKRLLNVKFEL